MKKVEAIIKPFKLDDVKEALAKVGVDLLTVSKVQGFGRQEGHNELYRGVEYVVTSLPRIKIEMVLENAKARQVVEVLRRAAKTGKLGDGKVSMTPVDEVVRIRTGEHSIEAL
jgi:nitrogen regulatory protein P-II 1